ncbi:MAG: hypothetical protein GY802_25825, partial [Gammaproteobacteria bacterium]|nr:hypothetical protein [Gammaproteobacteria bacterium]
MNLSLVLIAFIFVIALLSNKRTVRRGIPVALTLVMIVTPILQAAAYTQPEIETVDFANAFNTHVTNTQAEAPAPAVESYAAPLSLANETIADYAPDLACGDSSESIDSDLDGLNDFVELCLGTDPFSADTDIDNVSDKLEVDGFLIDGVRWYSNPLQPDSNRDGLQ